MFFYTFKIVYLVATWNIVSNYFVDFHRVRKVNPKPLILRQSLRLIRHF